jgi:hypothetical protein
MNKKKDNHSNDATKPAMVLIVISVVAAVYFLYQYLLPQFEYEQKFDKASQLLITKSPEHKLLVENYLQCRSKGYSNNSRPYCINVMQELSDSEGLQDKFEEVYSDIKNELWKIKRQ